MGPTPKGDREISRWSSRPGAATGTGPQSMMRPEGVPEGLLSTPQKFRIQDTAPSPSFRTPAHSFQPCSPMRGTKEQGSLRSRRIPDSVRVMISRVWI